MARALTIQGRFRLPTSLQKIVLYHAPSLSAHARLNALPPFRGVVYAKRSLSAHARLNALAKISPLPAG